MDKESFARKLQDIIRDSGIRQTIIAEAMDLSSAAISQFTHGTLLPKPDQLSALLSLLCVELNEQSEMMKALYKLREEYGETDLESEGDEDIEEEDDDEFNSGLNFENVFPNLPKEGGLNNMLIFAEPIIEGTPVIDLQTLNSYEAEMSLHSFATLAPHDLVVRDHGAAQKQVVIKAIGPQLGLRYCGMVQIVIAEDIPRGLSALTLLCLPGKKYRIIPSGDKSATAGLESLFDPSFKNNVKPLWSLPVFELSVIPLGDAFTFGVGE